MLPLDETLCPLELERQDCPWLSSAVPPSAQEFLVPPCFPITFLSGPFSPAELPQGIFCRLEGLEIQGKGLEFCPAAPRSLVVVFKGFLAMPNCVVPLLPLHKCKLYGSTRGPAGAMGNWSCVRVAAHISVVSWEPSNLPLPLQ